MLFFPFLAALIWYYAGKYRRSWRGVVAILAGAAVFLLLEILLIRLGALHIGGLQPWIVVWMLIVSSVLVIGVAIFIVLLPLTPPPYVHCRRCRYNLSGLDAADLDCPECGLQWSRPLRCPHCRHDLHTLPPAAVRCPECRSLLVPHSLMPLSPSHKPPPGANQQHKHRQPRDQHPADRSGLPLAQRRKKRH